MFLIVFGPWHDAKHASSSSADRGATTGAGGADRAPTAAGPTAGAALGAVVAPARYAGPGKSGGNIKARSNPDGNWVVK